MSPTGVYCGIGACSKCQHPRCTHSCHRSKGLRAVSDTPKRTVHKADAVFDADGNRVCPGCLTPFVKTGRGRYPNLCADCRA